VPEYSHQNR